MEKSEKKEECWLNNFRKLSEQKDDLGFDYFSCQRRKIITGSKSIIDEGREGEGIAGFLASQV